MKPSFFHLLILAVLMVTPQPLFPKDLTKEFNDPRRKVILDAIHRDTYEKSQLDVVLTLRTLNVEDGWAWFVAGARSKDGKSNYEDIVALLHYEKGKWELQVLPCTDDPDEPECFDGKLYNRTLFRMYPKMPRGIIPR